VITTTSVGVNGVELDVHSAGDVSSPTVLLCHGFPESAYSWRHQMAALAEAGYHAVAPDQRGYARSTAPRDVDAYGIAQLTGDLCGLLDHFGKDDAVWVGHDWGAIIVWEAAKLHAERMRAVCGVSVPFVQWPGPPTQLMRMTFGDRFFYMLYFQQVGPPETELEADVRHTMRTVLYAASGAGMAGRDFGITDPPPMAGTGFLTAMPEAPPTPFGGPEGEWLTDEDLSHYVEQFAHSGFFGPVSYYRNLDANYAVVDGKGPADVTMPSCFVGGTLDPVMLMDPNGLARMESSLPDYRGHVMIDGAGHWIQQEAPAAFNAALLRFLRTV
jgi:pimeloyl-ACP methyl ester carboxylesterase